MSIPQRQRLRRLQPLFFGIGVFASAYTYPFHGLGFVVSSTLSGIFLSASAAALCVLDLLVPPHHDMKQHVYKPGECDGGRLYYEGDVPILSLEADDPFKAGKAHGYLCGEAIDRLTERFALVLHTLGGVPRAENLSETLTAIQSTIPPEYLSEMQGLVEGYNQWANEQSWWKFPKTLTLNDILLFSSDARFSSFST